MPDRLTVSDLIEAGFLDAGEKLFASYRGVDVRATVLKDGRLRVGRHVYPTPSAAASAAKLKVSGEEHAANGWTFWHAPSGPVLDDLRRRASAGESAAA